jgi:hypothetical protein
MADDDDDLNLDDLDLIEPEPALADGEPEPEPGDPEPEPVRRRGEDRIRALNERLRVAERERQDANRRLDEMLARRADQQAPMTRQVESEAQRQHRRSSLTPEERIAEDLRESEQRMTQQMQGMQATNWDNSDRALYQGRASSDPLYRRWSDRVETEVKRLQTQGQYGVAREAILKFLLGSKVLEQRDNGSGKKRRDTAARRVAANTTRPSQGRSDANSGRRERSGGKSLEERLADTQL